MDVASITINPLTLRFDCELEREYQRYFVERNLGYARLALISGIAFVILFAHLDHVLTPAHHATLWLLRLGIVAPLMLAFLAFTYTPWFPRVMQPALAAICVAVAIGLDAMNVVSFEDTGHVYFIGIILVNMYLHTLGRVQWSWAAPVGILNAVLHGASLSLVEHVSNEHIASIAYFGGCTLVLGMFACYTVEHLARREFLQSRRLIDANVELRQHSSTDALTSLLNRRSMLQRLHEESARSARTGRAYTIAIADADHFKRINDRWGHACGDIVLKRIAQLMRETLRGSDIVARWGGEEFLMLFSDTRLAGARIAAEQIRRGVRQLNILHDGEEIPVSITIGIAEVALGEEPAAALRRADRALYEGKRLGRNRTTSAVPMFSDRAPAPVAALSKDQPGRKSEQ